MDRLTGPLATAGREGQGGRLVKINAHCEPASLTCLFNLDADCVAVDICLLAPCKV